MFNIRRFIAITVASIMLISIVGVAFAEKSIVEVPFESHGQTCSFDEIAIEYQCVWQGFKEVYTIEDLENYKDLLTADRYEQEIQKLNKQALEEIAAEKAKLTPNELVILEIENKLNRGIATATESVYMNLLKELNTCKQGMDDRTQNIQTAREFEVSDFPLWSVNNVKYEGALGELVMAIEECQAQNTVYALSIGYENFEHTKQYSLADKFTPDVKAVNYDSLLSTSRDINSSLICDSNQHSQQYKKQFGCLMLYDGFSAEEIKRQNEIRFGTDGKINYQSLLLDDYHDFLSTYGARTATIEDKKVQELIAEPIARKAIEDNHFYQNKLKAEE